MNKEIRQYCDGVSIHEIDEDVRKAVADRLGPQADVLQVLIL